MKKILIIGATSAIAQACARIWAAEHAGFALVGRDSTKLQQTGADLKVRGASVVHDFVLDLNDTGRHSQIFGECFAALDGIDIVLIAHGTLPDQTECEKDVALTLHEFSSNGLSVIAALTDISNRMQAQGRGTMAVISSVAGDRGRASNYVYGAAKSAVSAFCEGLRGRLFRAGVHVLTIKPGFVDTPMTRDLPLPRPLVASPERVAGQILRAIARKQDTLYTPGFWALIMFVIRTLPSWIFKRMKL